MNGIYKECIYLYILGNLFIKVSLDFKYKVGKKEQERVIGSNELKVHDIPEQNGIVKIITVQATCLLSKELKKLENIKYKLPAT